MLGERSCLEDRKRKDHIFWLKESRTWKILYKNKMHSLSSRKKNPIIPMKKKRDDHKYFIVVGYDKHMN